MLSPQPHVICPHTLCPKGACAEHLADKRPWGLLDPLGFCERAAEKQTGAQDSARGPGQRASSLCDAGPKPAMSLCPRVQGPTSRETGSPWPAKPQQPRLAAGRKEDMEKKRWEPGSTQEVREAGEIHVIGTEHLFSEKQMV